MTDVEVTEAKVTYTTKELLKRIDDRFERLEVLAQMAPTRAEFDATVARIQHIETEAVALRAVATALKEDKSSRFNRSDKIVLSIVAVFTTVLNILALAPDII